MVTRSKKTTDNHEINEVTGQWQADAARPVKYSVHFNKMLEFLRAYCVEVHDRKGKLDREDFVVALAQSLQTVIPVEWARFLSVLAMALRNPEKHALGVFEHFGAGLIDTEEHLHGLLERRFWLSETSPVLHFCIYRSGHVGNDGGGSAGGGLSHCACRF